MTIRNRKIPKVRLDQKNVDSPTINRALDNIIDNLNPFIDEATNAINNFTGSGGPSSITITPQGAPAVSGNSFTLLGAGGITYSSNGSNTITITQAAAPAVTSSITLNADTGSISGSTFNILADGCCIHTETSGSNTLIISSSAPCNFQGSTNISVTTPSQTIISGSNPNTILLGHFDSTLTISPGLTAIDYGQVGSEHPYPAISWQGFSTTLDTTIKKFGSGSANTNGNYLGVVSIDLSGVTSSLGTQYLENVDGTIGDFTLEWWIYPTSTTTYGFQNLGGITKAGTTAATWGFGLFMYLGQLNWCDPANPAGVFTGYTFTNPNQWYALAVCRKGSTTRVYVDGVLVYTIVGADFKTGQNVCILGQSPYGYYLHVLQGNIDECRYSNVAYYTGSTYQTQSAEFPSFSGVPITYVDDCTRRFALTGAICSDAVITSSYPCPQYLNTPFTGATDAYVKVKNQITTKDIWLTPADQIDAFGKDRQNAIGLRGIDADQAIFYSWDGGDVRLLGGTSRIGHAGNSKGGNILINGGEGGGGTSGVDGGPGGDVNINGGVGGGAGVGANFGASGSINIGNNTNVINIGNNAKNNANQFATTTTISGNFIAPILGDVSGNANVTKVVALQGNPVKSGSIAYGAPLIYGSEGWFGQLLSGSDPTTISLLHFDGADGSQVFPDTGYYSGSAQQINWQQVNGAALSTGSYQFGSASLELQVINSEIVTSSATSLFEFIGNSAGANTPNGDYTIELWFYLNAYGPSFGNTLFHLRNPSVANPQNLQGIHAWVTNGGALNVDNGVTPFFSYPSLVTTGSWHNFVMVRQGTAYRFYYDGVAMGGGTTNGLDCGPYLSNSTIQIGQYAGGGIITTWDGYIDEFRISNVARYAAGNIPATMVTQSAEWANAYPQVITQYGDISGSFAGFVVTGLQGNPLSASNPSIGESLVWDGTYWRSDYPATASYATSASFATTASFAVTASWADTANATQIQGIPVTASTPNDGDILVYVSSSNHWQPQNTRYYGSFCDLTTQTASATTAAYPMKLDTTEEALGVSIVSGSQITFAHAGTYNIQFSAQLVKNNASAADVDIWLQESGSNVPRSNTNVHVVGNNAANVAAWNWVRTFPSGSYAEIMWRTSDTDVELLYETSASSPTRPEIPSVIVSVSQV